MKFVLLLSLVALCYSLPTTPWRPKVDIWEDGTISITGVDGRKVVFSRIIGIPGPKNVEIFVSDPNGSMKPIKVDRENNLSTVEDTQRYKRSSKESKKGKSQADILSEVFEGYEGIVDEKSFVKILNKIESYVKSGDLDPSIFEVLKNTFEESYGTKPEVLYYDQDEDRSMPVGYSQKLAFLKKVLETKPYLQQLPYAAWYGTKQPATKIFQEPGYTGVHPYLYRSAPLASEDRISEEIPLQYRELYVQETPAQAIQQQWEYLPYQYGQSQVSQRLPWYQALKPRQWMVYPYAQPQKQYLYEQELTQPQKMNLYGQDWVLPKQQMDLSWNKLQEQQSQQMNLYGQDWLQQKLQMNLPWNKAQGQYYEPQQVWNMPQDEIHLLNSCGLNNNPFHMNEKHSNSHGIGISPSRNIIHGLTTCNRKCHLCNGVRGHL
ncbi:hypothetical protein JTB14_027318 [Gonioctena quinquepunctata]|nr:hypothetical protein JTB14_027318 [Gonioctena quinquepunctata]